MGINYPNGIDTFNEPSLPEYTSLSSAGTGTRAHVEHHRDLGDAVEALQAHAAKRGHDHSGDATDTAKGARLSWKNTHEASAPVTTLAAAQAYADTDLSALSVHHTLATNLPTSGTTGQYQAAPGHHTHDYTTLTNIPWRVYATKPSTAADGALVYETDTNCFWVRRSGSWVLLPMGNRPICRLRQQQPQYVNKTTGSPLTWDTEEENNLASFGVTLALPGSEIPIPVPGLYHVEAVMQWDSRLVPDEAYVAVLLAGQETGIRQQQWIRGNGIQPGFSQSVAVAGYLRVLTAGQAVRVKVAAGGATVLDQIASLFEPSSRVQSRIDLIYISP